MRSRWFASGIVCRARGLPRAPQGEDAVGVRGEHRARDRPRVGGRRGRAVAASRSGQLDGVTPHAGAPLEALPLKGSAHGSMNPVFSACISAFGALPPAAPAGSHPSSIVQMMIPP